MLPLGPSRDPRWGPPLDEYLGCPVASLEFLYLPTESMVTTAIGYLYDRNTIVTFETLEIILSIIYRPRLMTLLLDQRAVTSCMDLLWTYAARNHLPASNSVSVSDLESGPTNVITIGSKLFEHSFGFLVLHVLALVLQAGMLHCLDNSWLENLPRVTGSSVPYGWNPKVPLLNPIFTRAFCEYLVADVPSPEGTKSSVAPYEFEWCKDTWGANRACLPSVGGFTFHDAEFILRQFFDYREIFLKCCMLPSASGWSVLVLVVYLHIKEQSMGDQRIRTLWKKHYDILFRYSLASGVAEDSFLQTLCESYFKDYVSDFKARSSVVNVEDARRMQEAYSRKFFPNGNLTHQRTLEHTLLIAWYVRDNLANYLSLALNAGETTLEIIWDVLTDKYPDESEPQWADIDLFIAACADTFL
ncbi:hypothetical protein FRC12_001241 [Ceratobasidium sp. 428]|nr:hypothetical protein FRC12_001241 [Ceratobasidium sp. 428]